MGLDDIVSVDITTSTATPTRPGFGTPLLMAYHTRWTTDLVREYASLTEMTDDGFLTTDVTYKMAQSVFAQNPRPKKVKVGRRTQAHTQTVKLTPTVTTEGYVYNITIGGVTATYTVGSSSTVAIICSSLAGAINGLSNTALHTATDNTTNVTVAVVTPGNLLDYADWSKALGFEDITADPGVAADLASIQTEDDDWYGLLLDSASKPQAVAAAAAIESTYKVFVFNTSDSGVLSADVTTDVFSTLKAANYFRTIGIMSSKQLLSNTACAWVGNRFPATPGSDTWAFKTLAGVTTDVLSGGQVTAVMNKRGSVYTDVAGVSVTQFGKTFGGEWADVVRGLDWLRSEIKIRVYSLLVNSRKVPYTDTGVDLIKAVLTGTLVDGIRVGLLAKDPAPTVTAPLVADVDPITKGNRILPDVVFNATLSGAIHIVNISGTVSV